MSCKHVWVINPEDQFPIVECKLCHAKESLLNLSDAEIRESFGENAEAILVMKNVAKQFVSSVE